MAIKTKRKVITEDQAFMYQLVESTLKLNLDTKTSIECINLALEHTKEFYTKGYSRIDLEKMNNQNYLKYVRTIKNYSKNHKELKEQKPYHYRNLLNIQLEKILFNVIDDPIYHKLKSVDTDDLILKSLIHLYPDKIINYQF